MGVWGQQVAAAVGVGVAVKVVMNVMCCLPTGKRAAEFGFFGVTRVLLPFASNCSTAASSCRFGRLHEDLFQLLKT